MTWYNGVVIIKDRVDRVSCFIKTCDIWGYNGVVIVKYRMAKLPSNMKMNTRIRSPRVKDIIKNDFELFSFQTFDTVLLLSYFASHIDCLFKTFSF